MTNKLMLPAILAMAFLLTGCATIFSGSEQAVTIRSSNGKPISGDAGGVQFTNQSTTVIKLKKYKDGLTVQTTTPGCQPVHLGSHLNPIVLGNIVTGGFLGTATDAVTGSLWEYDNGANAIVPCNN